LSETDRTLLFDHAREFDQTRFWEGLDGLEVNATMRGVIAAHACLLTVGIGKGVLKDVTAIILAPSTTTRLTRHTVSGSIVSESEACLLGEALLHGPVRLAWDRVFAEWRARARTSVVIHEFAHKIDMSTGVVDGAPPIGDRHRMLEFAHVADETLEGLRTGEIGAPLRPYAATSRSELFAVATEAFFLEPDSLQAALPDLYEQLVSAFRQNPALVHEP
jgi:Mlc titration factor MtfA (ptsG expression regulator)